MRVTMATAPARPGKVNEDFVGVLPNAAVLVDGAGISGIEEICRHGVAWYAAQLGAAILAGLAHAGDKSLQTALADAIEHVTDAHRTTCAVEDPSSPSATVAILRVRHGRADYLLLGDSVLVLDTSGGPVVIADRREVEIGRAVRAAYDNAPNGPEKERARAEAITVFRANRNQPGGFWVAKDDPRAAIEAIVGSRAISRAVLLSNGASRIVDRFRLTDWPGVLAMPPEEIIRRVREAEAADGVAPDDATIASVETGGEAP